MFLGIVLGAKVLGFEKWSIRRRRVVVGVILGRYRLVPVAMTVYMPAVVIMNVHVDGPDAMRMIVMETARIGYYYDGESL